jgi:hypothetical protein
MPGAPHRVGTRAEWLAARIALLEQEKELTRRSDELAQAARAPLGSDRQAHLDIFMKLRLPPSETDHRRVPAGLAYMQGHEGTER